MPESRNWAISVWDQSFTTRRVVYSWATSNITLDGDGTATPTVANIQDLTWHTTPNENSLEATWLGDSNGSILNISPQDRIIIYTLGYRTGEDTSTYYPRFRGYASLPANQHHSDGDEHQYRAMGLYRLLESVDTGPNHQIDEGQDLASGVADAILDGSPTVVFTPELPAGVTHTSFSSIGVTNTGKINPDSADLAQNLDALVTLAEAGGVTAAWGVKPDGSLYFEVISTDTLTVQEGTVGTRVEWSEPQADEIITAIRWMIADGNRGIGPVSQAKVDLSTPDPVTLLSDSGITTYGSRTVPLSLPAGVSGLKESSSTYSLTAGTLYASWVGSTQDATADLSRAYDGDPTSYAVITPDASGVVTLKANPGNVEVRMVSVSLTADPDSDPPDRAYAHIKTGNGLSSTSERASFHNLFGSTKVRGLANADHSTTEGLNEVTETLVFGDRGVEGYVVSVQDLALTVVTEIATGTARVAIADLRAWEVDDATLDALAEQEYRFPEVDAFEATIQGESALAGLASITKLDGTTLSGLSVEALGTRISGDGVETLVTVGPRTPAHVTEELNRIRRRDRLAALAGARAGRRHGR